MKFAKRTTLLLMLVGLISGCGIFGKEDPERDPLELTDFKTTLSTSRVWTASPGRGLGDSAPALPLVRDGDSLWLADYRGRVHQLDAARGRQLRRFDLRMELSAGPAVYDDVLLFGTMEGQLLNVDKASGQIVWRAQLSSEILAQPVLQDGVIVVRCIDGRVFGLDADTGRRQWVYDRSVPLLTLRGNSDPQVRGEQVFIGHDDGVVTALGLEAGEVLWEQRVGMAEGRTQLDRLADIDGPMQVVGLDLYVASEGSRMASVALDSGRLLWVKEVASPTGTSVSRTHLAVSGSDDRIYLLDRRSGSTLWVNEQLLRRRVTRPVIQGNFVAVADQEGYIHWMDADDGSFVARERGSRRTPADAPLVIGNMLYMLDVKGRVSAWRVGGSS
ncbi:MAG: outer membrane protein assembly factor BamB [Wenzhouxiangellaceae bacterium]